jgi:alpha-ketoglutarate-dependent taurine dioxygenase
MATNGFEVRRLSGSIGAEILGIDLASEPGDNVIGNIRQVWLKHNVIFFRDQDLPPAKFLAFAKRFGEVVEYPFVKGIEGFPEIVPVIKLEHEIKNFGGIWHTDTAYLDIPPMGTMLIAREVPPYGGVRCSRERSRAAPDHVGRDCLFFGGRRDQAQVRLCDHFDSL